MAIAPYIEGETNLSSRFVSGGMGVSTFEHVLQGIDQRKERYRYGGVLPVMGAGNENNIIDQTIFGPWKDYDDTVAFSDRSEPTAEAYVRDLNVAADIAYQEGASINGIIEPLTIRDVATLSSIESPFISHSVKGLLSDGNNDIFNASDRIFQFIEIKAPRVLEPFEDSDGYLGTLQTASIKIPGFISELRRLSNFYDDSNLHRRNITNNSNINSALFSMTGSKESSIIPIGNKSATTGYTYYSSSLGTDSIAFGNLIRG